MDTAEKRKARRFDLRLPFELLRKGATPSSMAGETCNLSSGGVLFVAPAELPIGESIEYLITLPTGVREGTTIRLRCVGKVVRSQPRHSVSHAAAVAATLERYEFLRR